MIYTSEHPGPWQTWITKPENAKLNIQEARSKYLKEQLLFEQQYQNYMINQASTLNWNGQFAQGGPSSNTIMSNSGFSAGALATISGFTSTITLQYEQPVRVSGTPQIIVGNSQAGGGSSALVTYSFSSLSASGRSLTFSNTQAASANGTGVVARHVLPIDGELFDAITQQATSPTQGSKTGISGVYASGTGGTGGSNITADIEISALQNATSILVKSIVGVDTFQPGNTFTFAGSDLGGSGSLIVTLRSADLTGDVLTNDAGVINLNSGTIVNENDEKAADLNYGGSDPETKTAVAS